MTLAERVERVIAEMDVLAAELPGIRNHARRFQLAVRDAVADDPKTAILRAIRRNRHSGREIQRAVRHFRGPVIRVALDEMTRNGQLVRRTTGRTALYFEPDENGK